VTLARLNNFPDDCLEVHELSELGYRKSATAIPTPALAKKKTNPLLKFSSITSGCQLFAKENSESIMAASHQRLLDTEIRPSAEPIRSASPHAHSRVPVDLPHQ
jgi:hypothetical protein